MGKYRYKAKAIRVKNLDSHHIVPGKVYITDPGGHPSMRKGQTMHESTAEFYETELDIDECRAIIPETDEIVAIPGLGQRKGGVRW
jgi:hypothetical protein